MSDKKKPKNSFRSTTVTGIGWSTFSQFYKQALQIIVGILLARFLTPEAFGLMGMVMVFIGFANVFKDMGFGAALIQKADIKPVHYHSVFWMNIALGLGLTAIFALASPFIADFYKETQLTAITIWLSLTFLIDAFGIVHRSIINKELDFKRLSIMEVAYISIAGLIAILMAIYDYGVWSLVVHSLIGSLASVVILWIICSWRPKFRFSWEAIKELARFSFNLLGFNTLNYWYRNADDLLVGRFLGSSALGIYNRAYKFMLFPLTNITGTISRVLFPAFSTIQDDPKRIGFIYLKITQTVALITFPMMMGLIVVAEDFVIAVFGPQWSAMIPIVRIFSLVGLIHSINALNGNIFQALGRTDLQLKVGGTVAVLGIVAITIGLWGGVYGVAIAFTIFSYLAFYPSLKIAVNLIHLSFSEVMLNMKEVFFISVSMAVMVYGIEWLLPGLTNRWGMLTLQIASGALIYFAAIHLFKIQAYEDLLSLVKEHFSNQASSENN